MLYYYNMVRKLRYWFRFGVALLAAPNTTHDSIDKFAKIQDTYKLGGYVSLNSHLPHCVHSSPSALD